MAFQAAKEFLEKEDFGDRIKEFDVSSATVELAAVAVGCEPAHIAKTLSFLTGEGPVLTWQQEMRRSTITNINPFSV